MNLNMKKNEMGGDGDSCCNPERAQLSLSSTLQSELLLPHSPMLACKMKS